MRAPRAPRRNASALWSASRSRVASDEKTTQVNAGGFGLSISRSTVPPQPISRSSQCAPRHRTCRIGGVILARETLTMRPWRLAGMPPELPWHVAARLHIIECLLIFEGIHTRPETVVPIPDHLLKIN